MRTDELPVVTITGAAHERGRAFGEALREQTTELVGVWKENIAQTHQCDPDQYLREFLSKTGFLESAQTWTPNLVYETEGIADGANLDWTTAFSLQLMDELWWYGRDRLANTTGHGCSTMGIADGDEGTTLVGQTMDIEYWREGFQALVRIENANDRPDALVYTTAGCLGLMGVNRPGLAVCVNALLQLAYRQDGVPVAFVIRGLLSREAHDDAVDFLRRVPHASGQHYLIGSRGRLTSLECSANQVTETETEQCTHTNHPLHSEDLIPEEGAADENSLCRLETIARYLAVDGRKVSVDDFCSALASTDDPDHPVSRGPKAVQPDLSGYTIGASVFDLKTPPVAHIAAGPPETSDFVTFTF